MIRYDGPLYGLLQEPRSELNRHMVVHLRFDREAFDTLKELLRVKSSNNLGRGASEESAAHRRDREALKRVLDQLPREYSDV